MTDLETSTPVEGGVAPTTPSQSQVATSSQATLTIESLQKEIADLTGQVRALQSGKDKGTFKLEKKVDDLEKAIAQYEDLRGEGLSRARAIREMKLDALLQEQTPEEPAPASVQPPPGSAPAEPTRLDVEAVLKAFGLDAADPQVLDVMRKEKDFASATVAFANLAVQRRQAPNPAVLQNTGGGSAVQQVDDLEAIEKKLAVLKAQPPHLMDRKVYKQLVQEYNRLVQQ